MIRHCVFLKFKPEITDAEKQSLYGELKALGAILPGIVKFDAMANSSPEIGMDKGFSDGFIIDFDTPKSRDIYLEAPEHKAVGAKLVAANQGGADGILVYDMEIA
ncbi:MAG: Dabb family protein [Lentilitoribacter sp.]